MEHASGCTVLIGQVRDQAQLYGVLDQVRDFGVELVAVESADITDGSSGSFERSLQHAVARGCRRQFDSDDGKAPCSALPTRSWRGRGSADNSSSRARRRWRRC